MSCLSLSKSRELAILLDDIVSKQKVGVNEVTVVFLWGLIVFEVKFLSLSFFFFFGNNSSESFSKSLE